jgi:hypothetical protein
MENNAKVDKFQSELLIEQVKMVAISCTLAAASILLCSLGQGLAQIAANYSPTVKITANAEE